VTSRARIRRAELVVGRACTTCHDWPADIGAAFLIAAHDPWRRDHGERRCPACQRLPRVGLSFSDVARRATLKDVV
jgi:hypothetical protein